MQIVALIIVDGCAATAGWTKWRIQGVGAAKEVRSPGMLLLGLLLPAMLVDASARLVGPWPCLGDRGLR